MATVKGKPAGYFEILLAMDCETTGLAFNSDDPSQEADGRYYQPISWGFIVANAHTLQPIEKLYMEIQWDGKSEWNSRAQGVHGLSKEHLAENGVTEEEAVEVLVNFLIKYFGPNGNIRTLGHNVATFDLWFLKQMLRRHDIDIFRFGNRHVDTSSLGFVNMEVFTSDQLFDQIGLPIRDPSKHNALTDAEYSLESARRMRTIFKIGLGEE